jgi:2-polyprenyl-3-methyl-5-hydroxy-6-metoxy-1,4-benzoquinol methylase
VDDTTLAHGGDKAGKEYWDRQWGSVSDAASAGSLVAGYRTRHQLAYFRGEFSRIPAQGKEILELGCAASEWLPRFANEFGLRVAGLDYSAHGCDRAREVLARSGVPGEIFCADMFSPPSEVLGRFDFVVSFGLVEHFDDLTGCLVAASRFLKSGGIAFTCIPNLRGLVGRAQKWLGPKTYGVHNPWDMVGLTTHLEAAGFEVLNAKYVMLHDFACCQVDDVGGGMSLKVRTFAYKWLKYLTAVAMLAESKVGYYPINRQTATYVYTTGRKV